MFKGFFIKMVGKNFFERVLLCIIAVPLIICGAVFMTWYNHLVMSVAIFVFAILGSREIDRILFKKNEKKHIHYIIPSLLSVMTYLDCLVKTPYMLLTTSYFFIMIAAAFCREIFVGSFDDFALSIERISKELFIIIYPNLLLSFMIRILNITEKGNILFLFLLCLIFSNDTFCYIGGMLFGKNNRGFLKASPKKSIAGFVSGYIFTIIIGYIFLCFIPKDFDVVFTALQKHLWVFILLSLATSTIANIGDLVESVLKRNMKLKDSGTAIIGRGGVLDSIDSILTNAPVFYLFTLIIRECPTIFENLGF